MTENPCNVRLKMHLQSTFGTSGKEPIEQLSTIRSKSSIRGLSFQLEAETSEHLLSTARALQEGAGYIQKTKLGGLTAENRNILAGFAFFVSHNFLSFAFDATAKEHVLSLRNPTAAYFPNGFLIYDAALFQSGLNREWQATEMAKRTLLCPVYQSSAHDRLVFIQDAIWVLEKECKHFGFHNADFEVTPPLKGQDYSSP